MVAQTDASEDLKNHVYEEEMRNMDLKFCAAEPEQSSLFQRQLACALHRKIKSFQTDRLDESRKEAPQFEVARRADEKPLYREAHERNRRQNHTKLQRKLSA